MQVLIIDDEQLARDLMVKYLEDRSEVDITEASNGFEGLKLMNANRYDVVLLDIQMPKLTGFEMLELIDNPPSIIFCTAYDEYAIKAFEKNAIDYLLKPFSKQRLLAALDKAANADPSNAQETLSNGLLQEQLNRIVVKNGKTIDIIPVDDICYLQSQDDYVEIHANGKKYLKQQRLKFYESALNSDVFVRVHRQFILNVTEIKKMEKFGKESYIAELKNGENISISASGYLRLKEVLGM